MHGDFTINCISCVTLKKLSYKIRFNLLKRSLKNIKLKFYIDYIHFEGNTDNENKTLQQKFLIQKKELLKNLNNGDKMSETPVSFVVGGSDPTEELELETEDSFPIEGFDGYQQMPTMPSINEHRKRLR